MIPTKVVVHPIVLLSVVDHYNRMGRGIFFFFFFFFFLFSFIFFVCLFAGASLLFFLIHFLFYLFSFSQTK